MLRFTIALAVMAVAVTVRVLLAPFLGDSAPLMPMVIGVAVTAWAAGTGPALVATAVGGAAGAYLFLRPGFAFTIAQGVDWVQLGMFVVGGVLISVLVGSRAAALRRMMAGERRLHAASERMRQLADDLERQVARRTEDLQAANAELQRFTHLMAHDLRAPLRGLQGFGRALLEDHADQLGPQGRLFAHRIVDAAARMDALIRDLLAYSRLSRDRLHQGRVEVASAVADALDLTRSDVESSGARIEIDVGEGWVWGHRATAAQVIASLVSNAVKFVPPGTRPRVCIGLSERDGTRRLEVADNGIGVPLQDRERIFGVFERLHGEDIYPGTGMGLAIAQRGAERMGGRLFLDAAPGPGSRFCLELPAAPDPTEVPLDDPALRPPAARR